MASSQGSALADPKTLNWIYRWDLDKTYLKTDFDTFRQLVKAALEKAHQKVAVPGAAALVRELRAGGDSKLCIVSGSPKQMRSVLEEKLRLDGVEWDELILKDNVRNLLKGRFRAVRGQVGYKLPTLLESRVDAPPLAQEVLFGDDAEADAFIYSLYADLVAGRVPEAVLQEILRATRVYPDDQARVWSAIRKLIRADPVKRIFIHLDRLTPPARFAPYGPRLVPVFNYFQAALVLMSDGILTAPQVIRVAIEMVQNFGYGLMALANSFQDLLRRGVPIEQVAGPLASALSQMRPVPDTVLAFTRRLSALGAAPAQPPPAALDYLSLLDDARPISNRSRFGIDA